MEDTKEESVLWEEGRIYSHNFWLFVAVACAILCVHSVLTGCGVENIPTYIVFSLLCLGVGLYVEYCERRDKRLNNGET